VGRVVAVSTGEEAYIHFVGVRSTGQQYYVANQVHPVDRSYRCVWEWKCGAAGRGCRGGEPCQTWATQVQSEQRARCEAW
jgi:hypothetical protein